MSVVSRSLATREILDQRSTGLTERLLLVCGILGALAYALAHDLLAALLYAGYSPFSQAVSELSSLGAPTRPYVLAVGLISDALIVAFGVGVWLSTHTKRSLRVTGGLLVAYGAMGPLWLPFPMTARGQIEVTSSLEDIGHLVLSAVTVVLIVSTVAFGAAAFGMWFRFYSLVTVAVALVFGAWTGTFVPLLEAGEPTPWMGVIERVGIGAFLLWVIVLAVSLLRQEDHA